MRKFLLMMVVFLIGIACEEGEILDVEDGDTLDEDELLHNAQQIFGALPDVMPGSENDTPARVTLGERLFHETALSINDTQSCASCHSVTAGSAGVDNLQFSPGAEGQNGTRNSPTVLNAGFQFAQFWDGRSPHLQDQAKGPILNPVEMGMPDEQTVIDKIAAMADYPQLFAAAFPQSNPPITYDNLAEAIAAFERTLVSNARFDDYVNGDQAALSAEEKQGLKAFIDIGCASCHDSPIFGGNGFKKMGRYSMYANGTDYGRFEVTAVDSDKFVFKTSPLRNIALTHPYFHDGSANTLAAAVTQMASLQLGVTLTTDQLNAMLLFLDALSDKQLAQ